jgi:hypothetical protein
MQIFKALQQRVKTLDFIFEKSELWFILPERLDDENHHGYKYVVEEVSDKLASLNAFYVLDFSKLSAN